MVLEVGWQDCQSSPTRTLYLRFCCSSSHADLLLSTTVLKAQALPIFVSFLLFDHPRTKTELFFLTQDLHCLFIPHRVGLFPTHRIFLVFYPRIFLLRICGWYGQILFPRVDLWALRCCSSRTGQKTINSFPAWSV